MKKNKDIVEQREIYNLSVLVIILLCVISAGIGLIKLFIGEIKLFAELTFISVLFFIYLKLHVKHNKPK